EQLCEQFALFERFHALQRELRFLKAFLRNSQNEVELRQRVMCCKAVRSQSSRLLKMVERGVDVVGQRMCDSQKDMSFGEVRCMFEAARERRNCACSIPLLQTRHSSLELLPRRRGHRAGASRLQRR